MPKPIRCTGGKSSILISLSQNKIISPKLTVTTSRAIPKMSKNRLGGDFCSRLLKYGILIFLQRKADRHGVLLTYCTAILHTWFPSWRVLDHADRFLVTTATNTTQNFDVG
ncbi:hypothetical protein C8P68_10276 [Mucilaginibacter yixingensis]|uniref:Uncharacterized protein n=1 Tax=Mucilaginibacter yixingensis TaxID=1295612 RepID=A0A2T5JBX8_9SPHI|nr:hypothetical protein C8P68_10276 [Mucilaginibacter yixingensis]